MLFIRNAKANAIVVILALTISVAASAALMTMPANAQEEHGGNPVAPNWQYKSIPVGVTPDYTITSIPFLSFTPNPIGVGQELLVNMWFTYTAAENRFLADFKVTITKPDGTQDVKTLNSYVADSTAWFSYVPEQVGTYTLQFSFPGEWFPAGYYNIGQLMPNNTGTSYPDSTWYAPVSTAEQTLIVQNDPVMSWHSALPTTYWTRPIEPNNREWAAIAGNYPYMGYANFPESATSNSYYGPFITGPKTPHIVWKRQGQIAGIIGGETGNYATLSSPSSSGTTSGPSVIYMGRCYATYTKPGVGSVAACYDLRTGEIYYEIPIAQGGVTPNRIAYWAPSTSTAIPGAEASGSFAVDLFTISGSSTSARLYKINPNTGAVTANISLPSFGSGGFAEVGCLNGYYLSYQNSGSRANPVNSYLINWTVQGSSSNFNSRIVSNISVAPPPSYRVPPTIAAAQDVLGSYDPESGIGVVASRFYFAGVYGGNLVGVNYVTGQVLWNITTGSATDQTGTTPFNMATALAENGRYYCFFEQGYWKAYDLRTGKQLWSTHLDDYPWVEFSLYTSAGYNGILYYIGYTGVWALDEATGDILWHYVDPATAFETPYTSNGTSCYSVQGIVVIDGRLYVQDNEHTPSQPATRGWGMFCLDAITGEFLWKIRGANLGPGAASDGYLTATSSYDGHLYVLGKGQSKTTVDAPLTAVPKGEGIVIRGTVLDMSPAQLGEPCVSADSMSTWMDYLHMQLPIDGINHNETITGVPVTLTAFDSSGNSIDVGTVTTNGYYGTFSKTWTPPAEGDYQIIASFGGDDSYGSSAASTAITVGPEPMTPETPEVNVPDYTMTIVGVGIAIIIAVVLAVAIAVLILRKR